MDLIFESETFKQQPEQAATHVLLIGCGEYPELAADKTLISPRKSVQAMANWFLGGTDGMTPAAGQPADEAFCNPEAPLGSLELLVSPTQDYTTPPGAAKPVKRPTFANINVAYKRWMARLADNPASRGIFYFCGHGVGNGVDQVLIADDFDENDDNPWARSFHVSNTCQAAIRKTPANLLFVIDACMEFNEDLLFGINPPTGLGGGKRNGNVLCSEWLVMRATTTNRLAYADSRGTARFTSALLQALKGYCGRQRPGQNLFDVTGAQLREATAAFLARLQRPGDEKCQKIGSPHGDGAWNVGFHVLNRRPTTLVELDVEPAGLRPVAKAFIEGNGTSRDQRALAQGAVQFIVPWGEWTYGACADGGAFAEQSCPQQLLSQAVLTHRFQIS